MSNLENIKWPNNPFRAFHDANEIQKYFDEMLQNYLPFCQNSHKFLKEIEVDPMACLWEVYLAKVMLEKGFRLEKAPPKGPDIKVLLDNKKLLWIEAVAVDGDDRVRTDFSPNGGVDEEGYLLRLTSGIRDKKKKIIGYIKDGVVGPDDFCVIAINTGKFRFFGGSGPYYPAIAKVAYMIGRFSVKWPIEDGKAVGEPEGFHPRRLSILKKGKVPISSNLFSQDEYKPISAFIYSGQNFGLSKNGENITTAYNPLATNKLNEELFKFGKRCFVSENHVLYEKYENGKWIHHESGF